MALSKEQLAFRKSGIGGSDATKIMLGDWHDLWLDKTNRKEPDDLSDVLPVQMGVWTEEFNRQWFQKQTDITIVTAGSENIVHPEHSWARANTDGFTAKLEATEDPSEFRATRTGIFEAKHVNQFKSMDECVKQYYAQLHHYMWVCDYEAATLSVLFGTMRWEFQVVERNDEYLQQLIQMEKAFWQYVLDDEEPPVQEAIKPPKLDDMRTVSYAKSKSWSNAADVWKTARPYVKGFKEAEKSLKGMLDDDVRTAYGDGLYISRSKTGSLTIREMNEHKEADFMEATDAEVQD